MTFPTWMPSWIGSGTNRVAADGYVVDTGVFLRWFVPQVGFEHAREVRDAFGDGSVQLVTTDAARYELPNVLRTRGLLAGHLSPDEYVIAATLLDDLGLIRSADRAAVESAATLAVDRSLRFYDALFVDLSARLGLPLLTSDGRLARAAAGLAEIELLRGVGR